MDEWGELWTWPAQVWNDVGVVIQYNSDEEQSISVEFHDTATHHAIHVNNTCGHTLADLSTSAVLLACEADDKNPRYRLCDVKLCPSQLYYSPPELNSTYDLCCQDLVSKFTVIFLPVDSCWSQLLSRIWPLVNLHDARKLSFRNRSYCTLQHN